MSNHYHLVVHDEHGRYPDFVGWLNARLTRGVNKLRGREDSLWEARQTSVVELGDGESVVEALAYVHLNPMAAGLVAEPTKWPGLVTGPDDFEPARAERQTPDGEFVVPELEGDRRKKAAKTRDRGGEAPETLKVGVPPTHAHLTPREFAALLRKRIEVRARWLRAKFEQQGRTFGTPDDALKVAWQAAPSPSLGTAGTADARTAEAPLERDDEDSLLQALWGRVTDQCEGDSSLENEEPDETQQGTAEDSVLGPGLEGRTQPHGRAQARGGATRPGVVNPTVKAASAERRAKMLTRLRAFREAYARALQQFRTCLAAVFPGGTWRLCRTLNLASGPAPTPAWMLA